MNQKKILPDPIYEKYNGRIKEISPYDFRITRFYPSILEKSFKKMLKMNNNIIDYYTLSDNRKSILPGYLELHIDKEKDDENYHKEQIVNYFNEKCGISISDCFVKKLCSSRKSKTEKYHTYYIDLENYEINNEEKEESVEEDNSNWIKIKTNNNADKDTLYLLCVSKDIDILELMNDINKDIVSVSVGNVFTYFPILKNSTLDLMNRKTNNYTRNSGNHPYCKYGENCHYGKDCRYMHIIE